MLTMWTFTTFDPHGLTLCVFEDLLLELLGVDNVDIETFDPHGLTLCVFEG